MTMVAGGAAGDYSTSIGDGSSDNSSDDRSSSTTSSSTTSKGRWKDSDKASDIRSAGDSLSSMSSDESKRSADITANIRPVQYHNGGKVRKTGPAVLKRNERVIPAGKRKKAEKVLRKAGMRLTNKKRGKKRKAGRSGGRS